VFSCLGREISIVSDFEATIEKLVYGGDGLARVDGRVTLAPYVLPGERVRLRAVSEKPGLIRAAPLEILQASPERAAPGCPYFGRCGGCQYQHASYEAQLGAKRAILVEELRRQAKIDMAPDAIGIIAGEAWGYRNRVQLHIEEEHLGYREAGSHKLCAIDQCPIASPKINEVIAALNRMAKDRRWPRFVRSLEIFTDEESVQLNVLETTRPVAKHFFEWCSEAIPGFVSGPLDYQGRFRVSGNSFFQVNRFLLDELAKAALEGAAGDMAVELYAGVGLLTSPLAGRFREVTAVEAGSGAVRDLRWNADRQGLANITAEQQSAEKFLRSLERAPDLILLDPPRAGLGPQVVAELLRLRPGMVTIVACDPVTLGRDLGALTAGVYRIERLTLVDLFPQTFHFETVAHLKRSE
jgi:23S rRNA (uracil1939-C5)-methyltransferase